MRANRSLAYITTYLTAISLMLAIASGCWSRREIETLGFVMALGIDSLPSGKLQVTAHFAKPGALGGGDQKASQEKPFWVSSAEGDTVLDAFRNLGSISPKRPYLPHNRFYLFGESLLREIGILPVIDFLSRNSEPRLTAQIVVAKGATARDLLQAEFSDTAMPSESAQKIMLYLHSTRGTIPEITLREFQDRVESEGIEPIALGAELIRLEPDISIEGELTRKEIKSTARLGGTAIFKGNYLVGWLDDLETRGLNWVLGKVKGAQVVFPQPGFEDKLATVEILRSSSKFKVEVQEGKIRANVEIDTVGNLGCVQEPVDLVQQPEIWTQLEKGLEKAIKDEVMHTAAKLQQIGADAIGFGQNIFRRKPKEWAKLKDQWDEMFPTVEVHVKVKASLRTTGMVMKSIETK